MNPILSPASPTFGFQESATRAPKKHLEQEDFLKLVMAQVLHQNPLEPKNDLEFITQMAQFASMEQMDTLSKSLGTFIEQQKQASLPSYAHLLGKQVLVQDQSGTIIQGPVESLNLEADNKVTLSVNKALYELGDLKQITSTL